VLRDASFHGGTFVDVLCYSLLEDEFRNTLAPKKDAAVFPSKDDLCSATNDVVVQTN